MKMKYALSAAAAAVITLGFVGCDDDNNSNSSSTNPNTPLSGVESVEFASIPTPSTDTEKQTLQHSSTITVDGEAQSLGFTKLMATGAANNGEVFGLVKDMNDAPIQFEDGSNYICNGTNDGVGSGLDFSSILHKDGKLYMVNQFECQIGAMYMFELEQNEETGALSAKADSMKFISQKDEFGGFVHCAGQATPWNSHLGSEEYETDARMVEEDTNSTTGLTGDKYYDETAAFWTTAAERAAAADWEGVKMAGVSKLSPYFYGWTPEVQVNSGEPVYMKHYSMGRFSHELSYVMPDMKTVYMTDDGTNVGLFMFVADSKEDLSSGTLYGAQFTQTDATDGGSFDISWIDLGHATDDEIRSIVAVKPMFSDIFETETPEDDGSCATSGFTSVNTTFGNECLKIKDGMETAASRLETRRYAAMKGVTTEFRKMEGATFDEVNGKLYLAMSEVARGMEDFAKYGSASNSYDLGGNNDIRVVSNACGAVYVMNVDDNLMATDMMTLVMGEEMAEDADGNSCNLDKISNPDNIVMLPGTDILMIGEDTGAHINNVIWAYNTSDSSLTRVLTTPLGAETTSPFWYPNVNGWGYMTAVTQHPDYDGMESSIGVLGPVKFK